MTNTILGSRGNLAALIGGGSYRVRLKKTLSCTIQKRCLDVKFVSYFIFMLFHFAGPAIPNTASIEISALSAYTNLIKSL